MLVQAAYDSTDGWPFLTIRDLVLLGQGLHGHGEGCTENAYSG
jgi:hypothetical protein